MPEPKLIGYQTWVVGMELGHYATPVGSIAGVPDASPQESAGGLALGFYLEFYPFRKFGVGYHLIGASADGPRVLPKYPDGPSSTIQNVHAGLLTAQWIVTDETYPIQFVLIGGYGRGGIEVKPGNSGQDRLGDATGPMLLGGAFVNARSYIWNARLGANRIDSHIHAPDLGGADGSATYVYVSMSVHVFGAAIFQ